MLFITPILAHAEVDFSAHGLYLSDQFSNTSTTAETKYYGGFDVRYGLNKSPRILIGASLLNISQTSETTTVSTR